MPGNIQIHIDMYAYMLVHTLMYVFTYYTYSFCVFNGWCLSLPLLVSLSLSFCIYIYTTYTYIFISIYLNYTCIYIYIYIYIYICIYIYIFKLHMHICKYVLSDQQFEGPSSWGQFASADVCRRATRSEEPSLSRVHLQDEKTDALPQHFPLGVPLTLDMLDMLVTSETHGGSSTPQERSQVHATGVAVSEGTFTLRNGGFCVWPMILERTNWEKHSQKRVELGGKMYTYSIHIPNRCICIYIYTYRCIYIYI